MKDAQFRLGRELRAPAMRMHASPNAGMVRGTVPIGAAAVRTAHVLHNACGWLAHVWYGRCMRVCARVCAGPTLWCTDKARALRRQIVRPLTFLLLAIPSGLFTGARVRAPTLPRSQPQAPLHQRHQPLARAGPQAVD